MRILASRGLFAAVAERFSDGAEHAMQEVVAACGHLIPPEIAVRVYARYSKTERPISEKVEIGRRWHLRAIMWKLGAEPQGYGLKNRWVRFVLRPGAYGRKSGEAHYLTTVTEADVREMRRRRAEDRTTYAELARAYGLCESSVANIVKRKSWRHVA